MDKQIIGLQVDDSLNNMIQKSAQELGLSKSAFIRMLLIKYYNNEVVNEDKNRTERKSSRY